MSKLGHEWFGDCPNRLLENMEKSSIAQFIQMPQLIFHRLSTSFMFLVFFPARELTVHSGKPYLPVCLQ